jgi:hypothetical protein
MIILSTHVLTNFSEMADTTRRLWRARLLLRSPQEPYSEIHLEDSCSAFDWQLMRRHWYEGALEFHTTDEADMSR